MQVDGFGGTGAMALILVAALQGGMPTPNVGMLNVGQPQWGMLASKGGMLAPQGEHGDVANAPMCDCGHLSL